MRKSGVTKLTPDYTIMTVMVYELACAGRYGQSMGRAGQTTLLLDVDGVLIFPRPQFTAAMNRDYRWRDGYQAFEQRLLDHPEFVATLDGVGDIVEVAGRLLEPEVRGLTGAHFVNRWYGENARLNRTLLDLVPRLGFERVYLATNQEPIRAGQIEARLAGYRWLCGAFVSSRIGYQKPDPRFFKHVLATLGQRPEEILFVDDCAEYIDAAASLGIATIHFTGNESVTGDRWLARRAAGYRRHPARTPGHIVPGVRVPVIKPVRRPEPAPPSVGAGQPARTLPRAGTTPPLP
jgi:HAD superfamily hydrolase (TIGR01509 family)